MTGGDFVQPLQHGRRAGDKAEGQILRDRSGPDAPREARRGQHALGLDREEETPVKAAVVRRSHTGSIPNDVESTAVSDGDDVRAVQTGGECRSALLAVLLQERWQASVEFVIAKKKTRDRNALVAVRVQPGAHSPARGLIVQ